ERGLAVTVVELAVQRHVGTLKELYTPSGLYFIQEGKDLTNVPNVIGTGGIFAHMDDPVEILSRAFSRNQNPLVLQPKAPRFFWDRDYVLWAAGLLGQIAPAQALNILKKSIGWSEKQRAAATSS
ncbi:MAG TPA: hypothetical protein GX735_00405, partial [Firmicutes bacterium]|nr:hypothetical protein [Bacillota bacterium]